MDQKRPDRQTSTPEALLVASGLGEGAGRHPSRWGAEHPSFLRRNLGLLTELGAGGLSRPGYSEQQDKGARPALRWGRGMEQRWPRDSPFGPRARVCPGPPDRGGSSHSRTGRGTADLGFSSGPQRGGSGVPRGARRRRKNAGRAEPPLHAPGLWPRRCTPSPPRTSSHLHWGLTWARRPSARRAVPSPGHRPCPPRCPPSPARPALAMARAAAPAALPALLAAPGLAAEPPPAPSGLRAPRPAPPPRSPRLPPPQPPPPLRSLPLP